MIRINLLGQARPKATKQAVPLEATLQILLGVAAVAIAVIVLSASPIIRRSSQLDETNTRIASLRAEKANLQQIKQDVDRFEARRPSCNTIDVIETLQRNRTGGQELLQMVANTVVRVDQLWLTSLTAPATLCDIMGEAGIDQLRR